MHPTDANGNSTPVTFKQNLNHKKHLVCLDRREAIFSIIDNNAVNRKVDRRDMTPTNT